MLRSAPEIRQDSWHDFELAVIRWLTEQPVMTPKRRQQHFSQNPSRRDSEMFLCVFNYGVAISHLSISSPDCLDLKSGSMCLHGVKIYWLNMALQSTSTGGKGIFTEWCSKDGIDAKISVSAMLHGRVPQRIESFEPFGLRGIILGSKSPWRPVKVQWLDVNAWKTIVAVFIDEKKSKMHLLYRLPRKWTELTFTSSCS